MTPSDSLVSSGARIADALRRPPALPPYDGPNAEMLRLAHEARLHRARAENAYRSGVRYRHLEAARQLERELFTMAPQTLDGCVAVSFAFLSGRVATGDVEPAARAWLQAMKLAHDFGYPE